MLTPRYLFRDDYAQFSDYFQAHPHKDVSFRKGEYLWAPGTPAQRHFYIKKGIAQVYVDHEDGHRKILSYHGQGTVFPGCQKASFKIENSIVMKAITDVEAMSFDHDTYYVMFQSCEALNAQILEWFACYINLLIYEAAHQKYNDSFMQLCNLLYLMYVHSAPELERTIAITQEELAGILGANRVTVAKNVSKLCQLGVIATHRNWIKLLDLEQLAQFCSKETQED